MTVFISDDASLIPQVSDVDVVFTDNGKIRPCSGCFGCWTKTPGRCIVHDGYESVGEALGRCDELVIISRCVYGSYSPFVKNVLDRAISYVDPRFTVRSGKMRHRRRYGNKIGICATFYNTEIVTEERRTSVELVLANARNFDGYLKKISFISRPDTIKGGRI